MDELMGEKIDIIEWNPDPVVFISNALSPAKVVKVDLLPEERWPAWSYPTISCRWRSAGRARTTRLAARLTGWKIDIKSESQYREAVEKEFMSRFTQAVEDSIANGQEQ